jgi:predicted pyridoxine 5'-phosphate oxidase superfamily flavin-nucleotide-binding protein
MRRVVTEQRLGFYASVCDDGTPNLSPKGTTFVLGDEELAFAEIRSPRTLANLRARPAVEVNVLDPLARRGYRFRGTATIHTEGDAFARGLARMREIDFGIDLGRVNAIVVVRVVSASELLSPAYDEGATEAGLVAHYRDRFVAHAARLLDEA